MAMGNISSSSQIGRGHYGFNPRKGATTATSAAATNLITEQQ